uniref:BZIP domain-containing protein n=1 Tax=Rhabditophanes sp. KR3021 TaxID=114890 RepID=A0AC35U1S4_9BILA
MPSKSGLRKRAATNPPVEEEEDVLSEEYALKRHRNNVAVNKTREKRKAEMGETSEKMDKIRAENMALEKKVETLKTKLSMLKEMMSTYQHHEDSTKSPAAIISSAPSPIPLMSPIQQIKITSDAPHHLPQHQYQHQPQQYRSVQNLSSHNANMEGSFY